MDFVKMSKIQMSFWFICAIVTLIMVIILFTRDMVETWYFLIPVFCVGFAFLRRWQFKKLTKSAAERDARNAASKKNKR